MTSHGVPARKMASTALICGLLVASLEACSTAGVRPDAPVQEIASKEEKPSRAAAEISADQLFAQGVAAFEANRFDEAGTLFERVLQRSAKSVNAQYNLGLVAERKGDVARAQEAYESALRMDPAHAPSLWNLGKLLRMKKDYGRAISLYQSALGQEGRAEDIDLLNNLASVYRLAKKYPEAEATVRRVLAKTQDNREAQKNLALIYYDQGNYGLAEVVSTNALKIDDKDPGILNTLGLIYLKTDRQPQAMAQFRAALAHDGKFVPAHLNLGALDLAYRDYNAAEKEFGEAAALEPSSFEAHLYLGYARDGQKARDPRKGAAAGEEFEKALAIRPDDTEALCGAGWAYAEERATWEKATRYLKGCKAARGIAADEGRRIDSKLESMSALSRGQPGEPPASKTSPESNGSPSDRVAQHGTDWSPGAPQKEGRDEAATDR